MKDYDWVKIINPNHAPSEWLALDLGAGELAAMALALENPRQIILLGSSKKIMIPNFVKRDV